MKEVNQDLIEDENPTEENKPALNELSLMYSLLEKENWELFSFLLKLISIDD